MPGVERTIEVGVPPADFYGLITDFESYPEFLPDMIEAEVLERRREVYTVRFAVRIVKRIEYVLRLAGRPGRQLTWELVEGFFRANEGGWFLAPAADGSSTSATYRLAVSLGPLVPRKVLDAVVGANFPKMLASFRAEAERRAG